MSILAFLPVLAECDFNKNATVSHSHGLLLITHHLNCSSQLSKQIEGLEKNVAPALKIIALHFLFFWLWAARSLSGSFETVINYTLAAKGP